MRSTPRRVALSELRLEPTLYDLGGTARRLCRASNELGASEGLLKEYREKSLEELDTPSLEGLVRWRLDLPDEDKKYLDSCSAFPRAMVCQGESVVGILMPQAPAMFMKDHRTKGSQPRTAEELGRERNKLGRPGAFYFEAPHKLAILGALLERLVWLHTRGVVIGDLQTQNVLVTADVDVRGIYLVDCDSLWLREQHVLPGSDPDAWHVGTYEFTQSTDRAKFARLVSCALCEDFALGHYPAERLGEWLPTHQVALLKRMWEQDPTLATNELRSTARSWVNFVHSSPGAAPVMYVWPSSSTGRVLWTPVAHAPSTPADPVASATPTRLAPPTLTRPDASTTSSPHGASPLRSPHSRPRQFGALVFVLVTLLLLIVALFGAEQWPPFASGVSQQFGCSPVVSTPMCATDPSEAV